MSRLNKRVTPKVPVEKQSSGKPRPLVPEMRESKGDKRQRAFENKLARAHEAERNQTHKDIQKQRAKR